MRDYARNAGIFPLTERIKRQVLLLQVMIIAVFLIHPAASYADNTRGKLLYLNHCQECHVDNIHMRKGRVDSLDVLRVWVEAWSAHAGQDWKISEINDVTEYLNSRFYLFSEKDVK